MATLFVHGTRDTFIPIGSSRAAVQQITRAKAQLLEIDVDPQYLHPQTQQWQAYVIRSVAEWLTNPS